MKLDRQLRKRGPLAKEFLVRETPEPTSWDPGEELVEQVAKWKELAGLKEEELTKAQKEMVIFSAWYALVDSEYNRLLQTNPWVQRFAKEIFQDGFTQDGYKDDPGMYVVGAYTAMLPMIQAFPALRQELKQFSGRENDFTLALQEKSVPAEELIVLLLQVWPERRVEILTHFSTFDIQAAHEVLDKGMEDLLDLESVKDVFLLFPETRKRIPLERFSEEVKSGIEVADQFGNFRTFYSQLFNLVLLGANSFELDENGQIHIELARKQLAQPKKLPERSQV